MISLSLVPLVIIAIDVILYIVYSMKNCRLLRPNAAILVLALSLMATYILFFRQINNLPTSIAIILIIAALALGISIIDCYKQKS